jgi:Mrp family chromosome partitioning ATPase
MTDLINRLAQRFDYVLLDTPAMLGIADVATLMQKVGGILWVVRQGHSRREAVEKARKFLGGFAEKSLGLIVNQADDSSNYGYYSHQRKVAPTTPSTDEEVVAVRNVMY